MIELNPYRKAARIFAFVCYALAGIVLVIGFFFTAGAATIDVKELPFPDVTNTRLAIMTASMFLIIALMISLVGWRVQSLLAQPRLPEKPAARMIVSCLRLGSLGWGLWSLMSSASVLAMGANPWQGEATDAQLLVVGTSTSVLLIFAMLSVAWFIHRNHTKTTLQDRRRLYHTHLRDIQTRLPQLADPQVRSYVQERTKEVFTKLDPPLKAGLLNFLSDSCLLTGDSRIVLQGVDFRSLNLLSINLPRVDLRGVDLEQAMLHGASLYEVNLQDVNLKNADLSQAIIQWGDLRRADLKGANLSGANLERSDLRDADLQNANLQDANLQQADLRHADLTGALLKDANLHGANLTGAIVTPEQYEQARLKETLLPDGSKSSNAEEKTAIAAPNPERGNGVANGSPNPDARAEPAGPPSIAESRQGSSGKA